MFKNRSPLPSPIDCSLKPVLGVAELIRLLLIITLTFVSAAKAAEPITVGLHENGGQQTGLNEIYHAEQDDLTLRDIVKIYNDGKFKKLTTAGSTGLEPGAFWARFSLKNTANSSATLHLEYVDHQLIDLVAYARPVNTHQSYTKIADLSLRRPFSHRPISHNRFVFETQIPAGATYEYLVKYNSDKMGFVYPSLRIWNPANLQRNHTFETSAIAFLFGGFFLMSIFAVVAGYATGQKIFYAYSIYSLSKIFVWATILGYTHQYVLRDNFHWSYMSMCGAFSIACGIIFARQFLQTRRHIPKLDYLLILMLAVAGFLFVSALFRHTTLSVISITLAMLLYPVLSVVGLVRWYQGSREAAVFSIAWAVLVFGLVVQALRDLGLVEQSLLNYFWPPMSSFTEMLTIMAAIGIQVHRLRLQKEFAERQYTQQLESSKIELEQQVRQRTQELEIAKKQAEREARVDPLTGIHNRRSFFTEAELRISLAHRKQQPLSLLMLDIDYFKAINDTFGHTMGDKALKEFCRVISRGIRNEDIFGRLGGEEFALLLNEETVGTLELAHRLRADIQAIKINTPEGELSFTASTGIAHLHADDSIELLVHKADSALYAAKKSGRNCVVDYDQIK